MNEIITKDGEVLSTALAVSADQSLAVSLSRAEIDQQIATARAFPRSIDLAVKRIMTLATLDEDSAEECVYALPRGGKPIKGPSVRLAEIIASQWGNARIGARVVHVDRVEKFVEAEGVFHDLETNAATTARVRRRISGKDGRLFADDMIIVTGNAACAIAKRNAVLGAVPKAVWRKAYAAVEQVIAGDVKTLAERRDRAMKAMAAFGVKPEQIFAALGIGGIDDLAIEHMTTLTGMHSALKNGEATVEEMFPAKAASAPTQPVADPLGGDAPKKPAQATQKAPAAQQAQAAINPAPEHAPQAEAQDKPAADDAKVSSESMPEHSDAAGDPDDIPADDGPTPEQRKEMERIGQLHSQARLKSAKGGKVFRLWLNSISPADQEALVPIKDELWGNADDFDANNAGSNSEGA